MRAFDYMWSLPVTWQVGSHAIWSAISKNHMLHTNFMALCVTERKLSAIKVLHCGNRDFQPFAPVTLTLTQWPSYTNLTCIAWRCTEWGKWTSYIEAFKSDRLTNIQTYRQQWRRYTRARQVKWPDWKIHRPWLRPAYCFASVIVWTENNNVTISDHFIRFILTVKQSATLAACALRSTFSRKKSPEKSAPGDLAWGFSDLEMTWLLYCVCTWWPALRS